MQRASLNTYGLLVTLAGLRTGECCKGKAKVAGVTAGRGQRG